MQRIFRRSPSAALLISILALIFAVGGGYAIAKGGGVKKQEKKVAKKVVNKLAPGLSVKAAKTADNSKALGGQPASAFGPVAYAHVVFNGTTATVDGAHAKVLTSSNVTKGLGNSVCFHDLTVTPHIEVATPFNSPNQLEVNSDVATLCGAVPNSSFAVITIGGANDFNIVID
jgi:hypothetical protein